MIELFESSGGWTIKVRNGDSVTNFECSQYVVTRNGYTWFNLDRAMRDARKLDKQQNETASVANRP